MKFLVFFSFFSYLITRLTHKCVYKYIYVHIQYIYVYLKGLFDD